VGSDLRESVVISLILNEKNQFLHLVCAVHFSPILSWCRKIEFLSSLSSPAAALDFLVPSLSPPWPVRAELFLLETQKHASSIFCLGFICFVAAAPVSSSQLRAQARQLSCRRIRFWPLVVFMFSICAESKL
jgi:hypothetical protein